ncbi:MAG: ABC transporter permease [Clostridiales bacterium]|nr:ABC transporter permease [Clostridiales bacterium]
MSIKRAALLVLLAAVMALTWVQAGREARVYEYSILSPKVEAKDTQIEQPKEGTGAEEPAQQQEEQAKEPKLTPLGELLKSLTGKMEEMSTAVGAWGLTAYTPGTAFTDGAGGSAAGLLRGVGGGVLYPAPVLTAGRHIYIEEIEAGAHVAVLDEKLALDLYRIGDPVGRKLMIGEHAFTIVGITRRHRGVGDQDATWAQVPLKALDKANIQTTMLTVAMQPLPGAGAYAALSQGISQWRPGGTFDSLPKEIYRARLPLRLLLCVGGLLLVALTLKLTGRYARRLVEGSRLRLQTRYANRMLPEFIGKGLLIALLYALNLAAIFFLLQELIAPVYVFPEWVPAILVEPKEIEKTFWTLRAQQTGLVALRTPRVLRLHFLHRVMAAACALAAAALMKPYHRLWDAVHGQ